MFGHRWLNDRVFCAGLLTAVAVSSAALAGPADGGQAPALFPPRPSPRPNEGTYRLRPLSGGAYRYDDRRFEARIAPDGHVKFTDRHFGLETRVFGVPLRDYRRPNGQPLSLVEAVQQARRPDPEITAAPFDVCNPNVDPAAHFSARCRLAPAPVDVVGTFDLTDEVMKLTGQGWYKYEKAKFLSATFEFRMRLAAERHAKLLKEALADLPSRLTALWNSPAYTPREKRRIVCLLWAEVDVADAPSRRAADVILTWVRDRLPTGSRDVYTPAELAACASDGGRPFSPYGVGVD